MLWVITGAGGQLGSVLLRQLVQAGEPSLGVCSPEGPLPFVGSTTRVDLTDRSAAAQLIHEERPSIVVHAAAVSSVAAAHEDPERARRVNAIATAELAAASIDVSARFVYLSTDMVFDGEKAPYDEKALPAPLSMYGRSKHAGELAVLELPRALVVRLSLLYGMPAVKRASTFVEQVRALREGRPLSLFHDEIRTPLALEDAASSLITVSKSDLTGVVHLGGPEPLSRLMMGQRLAEALGVQNPLIRSMSRLDAASPEPRARNLSLDSKRFEATFGKAPGRMMREALSTMDLG